MLRMPHVMTQLAPPCICTRDTAMDLSADPLTMHMPLVWSANTNDVTASPCVTTECSGSSVAVENTSTLP